MRGPRTKVLDRLHLLSVRSRVELDLPHVPLTPHPQVSPKRRLVSDFHLPERRQHQVRVLLILSRAGWPARARGQLHRSSRQKKGSTIWSTRPTAKAPSASNHVSFESHAATVAFGCPVPPAMISRTWAVRFSNRSTSSLSCAGISRQQADGERPPVRGGRCSKPRLVEEFRCRWRSDQIWLGRPDAVEGCGCLGGVGVCERGGLSLTG